MNVILQSLGNLRDLPMPTFNKIAIIVINFVAVSLVLTVLNHNKLKDRKSQIFVLMGISMLGWVDFAYLARIFGRMPEISIIFLKIAWLSTPFVFFFTYMTSTLLAREGKQNKIITISLLVVAIILGIATAFTNLTIAGIKYTNGILDIVYGNGFFPYLGGVFIMMFFTLAPLVRTKIQSKSKFFLIGVIIFYIMNLAFNITLPVFFHITNLYFLGDYSTIFLLGFTMYAILRHELFEIKVFATEALTLILWSILFIKIFFSQNLTQISIDSFVFALTIVFGILLIRSVRNEIKQREKLEELNKKIEELDKRKDEFLNVAAHELRAPMTAIKGYLSMLSEGDAGKLTPTQTDFLNEATNGNDRLIRLVNNMLNISRIEEGRMTYEMGDINLSEIVKIVHDDYLHEAKEKNLVLNLEVPRDVKDKVYVDKDRIFEVVSNLLSNAIKYTDKGSINIKLRNQDQKIIVEVEDTGPGISESDQQKLFQKFYRTESAVGKAKGTGLGLYVSRLLVEKFRGEIGVKSQTGQGSTFWFKLPLKS